MSAQPPAGAAPGRTDGLFGPESVTRRIMGQPVMWTAGFRAMYLQMLHPRVMRGTWQNTAFADPHEAWGRFMRTVEYVRTRNFGSAAEAERAGRRVRKIHASLTGTDPDGTQFRLDEPELLLWVHCGEVASYADIARRSGLPVSPGDLDTFVAEQRRGAALVGLDPGIVPASMADLQTYYRELRPRLQMTPEARQALLRSIGLALPDALAPIKLVMPSLAALGFGSLPRWARRLYHLPGIPVTDLAVTAALRACHEGLTRMPADLLVTVPRAA